MLSSLLRKPVCIDITESRESEQGICSLSREQLIDRIITVNPSATATFLDQFEEEALSQYLDHLTLASQPRGREARWIRPSRTPWACTGRACA